MANCRKCGALLKQPYIFCSNCGSRHDTESVKAQEDTNTSTQKQDGLTKDDTQKHDDNSGKNELIIGAICEKIYLN